MYIPHFYNADVYLRHKYFMHRVASIQKNELFISFFLFYRNNLLLFSYSFYFPTVNTNDLFMEGNTENAAL
jgi:hypothetical protein